MVEGEQQGPVLVGTFFSLHLIHLIDRHCIVEACSTEILDVP